MVAYRLRALVLGWVTGCSFVWRFGTCQVTWLRVPPLTVSRFCGFVVSWILHFLSFSSSSLSSGNGVGSVDGPITTRAGALIAERRAYLAGGNTCIQKFLYCIPITTAQVAGFAINVTSSTPTHFHGKRGPSYAQRGAQRGLARW